MNYIGRFFMFSFENSNCVCACLLDLSAQIGYWTNALSTNMMLLWGGISNGVSFPTTSFLLPSPDSFRKLSGTILPSALANPLLWSPSELPKAVTECLLSFRPALLLSLRADTAGTASRLCWSSSLTCHHLEPRMWRSWLKQSQTL